MKIVRSLFCSLEPKVWAAPSSTQWKGAIIGTADDRAGNPLKPRASHSQATGFFSHEWSEPTGMISRWISSCFRILWHCTCLFVCCALYPNLGIVPGEECEPTFLKSWSCFILINFRLGMSSATLRRYLQSPPFTLEQARQSPEFPVPQNLLSLLPPFQQPTEMWLLSL